MAKATGLGQRFYVSGVDLSGDTGSANRVGGGPAALELTGIDKLAFERVGGIRTGSIEWSSWFNPTGAHPVLSALPYTDAHAMYLTSTTLGDPSAAQICKQIDYAGTRGTDGSLSFACQAMSNAYGLEWGRTLTAGLRTDTSATNGASIDTTASASFGAQAYLQVTAFTGTSVDIAIEDSANDSSFSAVSGLAFATVSAAPAYERLQLSATATVRRYLRVVTSGTFSSVSFVVTIVKNQTTVSF